jgi:hypothetical protein
MQNVARRVPNIATQSVSPDSTNETNEITARALLRAFVVESMERKRRATSKLGFAQLDYGRLFVRDRWTLFAIARELGCSVEDLLEPPQPANDHRIVWGDIVSASESLMSAARSLRDPIRQVVLLRACGLGWRKIGIALPGRTPFSLADDYEEGIRKIWILASHECRTLAFSDHPKFGVVKRR